MTADPTPTTTQASGMARPNCSFCRSDVADRAEMDRQRRRAQLDAFDSNAMALVDHVDRQAAAMARVAREGL